MDEIEEALGITKNQKAAGQDGLNAEPVSYTHLDVYKRQLYYYDLLSHYQYTRELHFYSCQSE